ncbi:MAG: Ig-like domain-containing protein, partial [Gammaproteobacteria bacterium]|nr:Ig-like domain-containing protein [Gammaproteobacteria bacterium]
MVCGGWKTGERALDATFKQWISLTFITFIVVGCSANQPESAHLVVTPASKLLTQLGATVALQSTLNGGAATEAVQWQSADNAVATVDNAGVVTAVAEGVAMITATSGDLQGQAKITVNTHVSVLNVVARYEDKQYDRNGFTGVTTFKPIRNAVIEMEDANGEVVQSTSTDLEGRVAFDAQPTMAAYKLRIYADTDATRGPSAGVRSNVGARYAAVLNIADLTASPVAMDVSVSGGAAGAFNVLDVFTTGAQFVYA